MQQSNSHSLVSIVPVAAGNLPHAMVLLVSNSSLTDATAAAAAYYCYCPYGTVSASGYAKRGLRSAITSAVKEGITVHEVMNSSSSNQLPSPTVTAAANRSKVSATDDWSEVASEMMEVDKRWLRNKGRHAGMCDAPLPSTGHPTHFMLDIDLCIP